MRLHRFGFVILGLLVTAVALPAFAAPKDMADYPLRIHIYQQHWGTGNGGPDGYYFGGYHGYGKANLTEGAETHAMAYDFECDTHFTVNDSGESYPAKWKKPGERIEMMMGEIGSDKVHTCQLKVTLKETVYWKHDGQLQVLTQEEYHARLADRGAHDALMTPADSDSSHYPLQLAVLDLDWGNGSNGIVRGSGHANVKTAAGISSVDFAAECPVKFRTTPDGRYYRARWVKEGAEMQLLLHKTGDPTQTATCELKTSVHTDVYVLESAGVLKAVSQEKYKAIQTADAKESPVE